MWGNGANSRLGNSESVEQETPQAIGAIVDLLWGEVVTLQAAVVAFSAR